MVKVHKLLLSSVFHPKTDKNVEETELKWLAPVNVHRDCGSVRSITLLHMEEILPT